MLINWNQILSLVWEHCELYTSSNELWDRTLGPIGDVLWRKKWRHSFNCYHLIVSQQDLDLDAKQLTVSDFWHWCRCSESHMEKFRSGEFGTFGPSDSYQAVIARGLVEDSGISEEEAFNYLLSSTLPQKHSWYTHFSFLKLVEVLWEAHL